MKNISLFLFFLLGLCCYGSLFAAQTELLPEEEILPVCSDTLYTLEGNSDIVTSFSEEYSIKTRSGSLTRIQSTMSLSRENEIVESKQGTKYVRIFNKAGSLQLTAEVKDGACSYTLKKDIRVSDAAYLYIGSQVKNIEENF